MERYEGFACLHEVEQQCGDHKDGSIGVVPDDKSPGTPAGGQVGEHTGDDLIQQGRSLVLEALEPRHQQPCPFPPSPSKPHDT